MSTEIVARYIGDGRVELTHTPTGQKIVTDLPPDNGGKGRDFSPTDLLASSVASCILTIMSVIAERENINFENAQIIIEKHMQQNPRKVAKLCGKIKLPEGINEIQKKKLLTAIQNCPVSRSLREDIIIDFEVH
ncbi:MAG: OsmC family protein [Elusimicrobiales bacterium]